MSVLGVGLEEIGADRKCEGRVVDLQRDVFTSLLAGAFPAGADLRSVVIAVMDAIVGRVLAV